MLGDIAMEQHPVELCIDPCADADQCAGADSLESSVSTYDSIMQSLHEELNSANANANRANSANSPNATFNSDFAEFDFFNMDCATAISFDYEMNYTMKQLKHIAGYYGLKCKTRKADMIQDIVLFETDDKNGDAVGRRKRLFHYMDTLKNDEYLKSYVIM
jgi:hypothetical protein